MGHHRRSVLLHCYSDIKDPPPLATPNSSYAKINHASLPLYRHFDRTLLPSFLDQPSLIMHSHLPLILASPRLQTTLSPPVEILDLASTTKVLTDRNTRSFGKHSRSDIHTGQFLEKQLGSIRNMDLRNTSFVFARATLK